MKSIVSSITLLLLLALNATAQSKTYTISPSESDFRVLVSKAGLFSALAHDHEIGVKSFSGKVTLPRAGAGSGSLVLEFEAKSLAVLDKEPSEEDRKKFSPRCTMRSSSRQSTRRSPSNRIRSPI